MPSATPSLRVLTAPELEDAGTLEPFLRSTNVDGDPVGISYTVTCTANYRKVFTSIADVYVDDICIFFLFIFIYLFCLYILYICQYTHL